MSSLLLALIVVLLLSACFSGSETGMMALNRYQLNVWVASGSRRAAMIKRLLDRPDRLLGVILIGNTLANNLAVALLSMMVDQQQGPLAMMLATIALTLVMLVLVEVMPKTFAALQPKKVAIVVSENQKQPTDDLAGNGGFFGPSIGCDDGARCVAFVGACASKRRNHKAAVAASGLCA